MSESLNRMLPVGTIFYASSGEYSNYSVNGVYRVTQAFNPATLIERYLIKHAEQREQYRLDETEFFAWIVGLGLFESIHAAEWHICDYSSVEEGWLSLEEPTHD